MWHLGYRSLVDAPALKVQQALVVLDRPEALERPEIAELFPEHDLALAEARALGDKGLVWLRDVVGESRLDEVAELGALRARERVSA